MDGAEKVSCKSGQGVFFLHNEDGLEDAAQAVLAQSFGLGDALLVAPDGVHLARQVCSRIALLLGETSIFSTSRVGIPPGQSIWPDRMGKPGERSPSSRGERITRGDRG